MIHMMFPMLDEELEVTPEWGDQYGNGETFSLEGTKWLKAKWYAGSLMLVVTQLVDLIITPHSGYGTL